MGQLCNTHVEMIQCDWENQVTYDGEENKVIKDECWSREFFNYYILGVLKLYS